MTGCIRHLWISDVKALVKVANFIFAKSNWLRQYIDYLEPPDSLVVVVTAIFVGLGTGLGAVFFVWLLNQIAVLTSAIVAVLGNVGLILVMGAAGLIVGTIVSRWVDEARGGGIPEVMEAVALRNGRIRPRVALGKMVASALTIGSGGSAGREGPIVQIGSALGSTLGQLLHFSRERLRTLVACGAAAGISASFNAPIAGSLFALEVILGKFTVRYFGAVVISAVSAAVVARVYLGDEPAFVVPAYPFRPSELPIYVILGIIAALVAVLFVRTLYRTMALFNRVNLPLPVKAAIGMMLTALVGLLVPGREVLGPGLDFIGEAIAEDFSLPLSFMALLLVAKVVATSLTLGAGNSGGVFAPSLFLGATLGGMVGTVAHQFWPAVAINPGAYAIVGMAAVFSGAARAPITAVLIIFEMSNDYKLILPLMLATVLSTLLAEYLLSDSIYTLKLKLKGITLHRGRDLDLMQSLSVREAMTVKPYVVQCDMPLDQLGALFRQTHRHSVPVVDENNRLVGMVSLRDYEGGLERPDAEQLTVQDVATLGRLLIAYEDEPLSDAIQRLAVRGVSKMPVVTRERPDKVVGVIRRSDILRAYNMALARRVEEQAEAAKVQLPRTEKMKFVEIEVLPDSHAANQTVAALAHELPYDSVVVSIRRYNTLLIPHGDTVLQPG
ncbi:MAG TPA: chloride channel protein, partial [Anaerolineae bacterium]